MTYIINGSKYGNDEILKLIYRNERLKDKQREYRNSGYYKENVSPKKRMEYNKKFRDSHPEVVSAWRNKPYNCEWCGVVIKNACKSNHFKTERHRAATGEIIEKKPKDKKNQPDFYNCECGHTVKWNCRHAHLKTKTHRELIDALNKKN